MLKKTVLAAAITAAALLAVSPLAFASSGHPGHIKNNADETSAGLVNVADNNLNAPIQACNNDIPVNGGAAAAQVPVKDITTAATGALGILGSANAKTDQTTDNSRTCGDNSGSAGDKVKQHG